MTDDILNRLQSLADAASPGPWEWDEDRQGLDGPGVQILVCEHDEGKPGEVWLVYGSKNEDGSFQIGSQTDADREVEDWRPSDADAAFIAAAREAVPALVAEVRRLRALLADARKTDR